MSIYIRYCPVHDPNAHISYNRYTYETCPVIVLLCLIIYALITSKRQRRKCLGEIKKTMSQKLVQYRDFKYRILVN